jgi:hypothetical protein
LAGLDHSRRYFCYLPFLDFFDHCFSPFLPRFSMGPRASGPSLGHALFCGGAKKLRSSFGFFVELQTRKGDGQLTELAEVRHVASAHW